MTARELIERIADEPAPGIIHPAIKQKFQQRAHPLGAHPAYPEGQGGSHFEEIVASEEYARLIQKLQRYTGRVPRNGRDVATATIAALQQLQQIENTNKDKLEKLAVELLYLLPEFKTMKDAVEAGDLILRPQLVSEVSLEGAETSPNEEEEDENGGEPPEDLDAQDVDPEFQKRKFINAMIQGSAVSKNYAFELVRSELESINPELLNLYGTLMAASELGYWMIPDDVIKAMGKAGVEDVSVGSSRIKMENGVPVVIAQGISFPVLVQELVKGVMEVISYSGLPKDARKREELLKSEFIDKEAWDMMIGSGLWKRFVSSIGSGEQDLTLNLYNKIVQMPPEEFNTVMKNIMSGGRKAEDQMKSLINELKVDIEGQDTEDFTSTEMQGESMDIKKQAADAVEKLLEFNMDADYAIDAASPEVETKPGTRTAPGERPDARPGTRPFRRGNIEPGQEPRPKAEDDGMADGVLPDKEKIEAVKAGAERFTPEEKAALAHRIEQAYQENPELASAGAETMPAAKGYGFGNHTY